MEKINDVIFLEVDKIKSNPNQPRKKFKQKGILELSKSIKNVGVIQPISVRKIDDSYELIAGERRLLATKEAGFNKIPTVVVDVSDDNSAILALVENIQREDLDFIEEALAYKALLNNHNISQKEIARRVGKSQSSVSNKLRILKHSDKIVELLYENDLTERHARALLKINSDKLKIEIIKKIKEKDLNVKQTDVLIAKLSKSSKINKIKNNTQYKFGNTIYINTIKKAYDEIINTGVAAEFKKESFDDYIEVKIKIYK